MKKAILILCLINSVACAKKTADIGTIGTPETKPPTGPIKPEPEPVVCSLEGVHIICSNGQSFEFKPKSCAKGKNKKTEPDIYE